MKGVIFNEFNSLVEEKFGLAVWQDLLDHVQPKSGGNYTSALTYPDEELLALVGRLSEKSGVEIPDLVKAFGEYLAVRLTTLYPDFTKGKTLKEFFQSVHDVIHVEVKKFHPDAELPSFEYEDPASDQLVMIYRSSRKLDKLAEGLVLGAAKAFDKKIDLTISKSYAAGDDHGRLEIKFVN